MSIQPKLDSKLGHFVDRLNEMVGAREVNEFELKRIENEAHKAKESNFVLAFTILGMVACLKNETDKMHAFHKNAIAYSNEGQHAMFQYAVSLKNLGLLEDSFYWGKKAYDKDPSNAIGLDLLIRTAIFLDWDDTVSDLVEKWEKLTGKPHEVTIFPEDDEEMRVDMISKIDASIENNPDLLVEPDQSIVNLANELIAGVDHSDGL